MGNSATCAARALGLGVLIAGSLFGCSADNGTASGEYSTERTLIVTGIGAPDLEGCGLPQAPVLGKATYRYRVSVGDGSVRVTELLGGCTLDARIEDEVVIADGATCALGPNAPLRELGVTHRHYSVFRLDPRRKTVVTRAVTDTTVATGRARSCAVSEERIVEYRP